MTRTIDFDAARAERNREPVTLRIGGRDYALTAGLPASVALDLMRFRVDGTDDVDVPPDEAPGLLERLFGSETWHRILDEARLEITELPELLEMTVRALNGQDDDPPNRRARRHPETARRASAGSTTGR